jgi:hypothetical protein
VKLTPMSTPITAKYSYEPPTPEVIHALADRLEAFGSSETTRPNQDLWFDLGELMEEINVAFKDSSGAMHVPESWDDEMFYFEENYNPRSNKKGWMQNLKSLVQKMRNYPDEE